ncbi:MAG TPA: nucleotidyltransferase family protein [Pyrinomonadaceae bacterium]|nr:nucleotidyltransferase family protein [Pyrinomonadaceae bacterium]
MMTQRQSYGSIILRLMLSGTLEPFDSRTMLWGELLHVAAQNGVLIRVVDQLQTIGLEPSHFFYTAVTEMRARNQRKLSLMARIGERCVDANIDFIFAKALQNYPDMGGDIDLYVEPRSIDVDAGILRGLKATPVKRNLRNLIDGSATYRLAGCDSVLDIHHGRVGMLGEHKLFVGQIIRNARQVTVGGDDFLTPSPEDQLILQAMQKVVQRSYLRLSDVLTTVTLFRGAGLNWNYILNTAKDLNILYGLSCYLNFVQRINREAFKEDLLRPFLKRSLISPKSESIEFKDGFYRFARVKVGSRGYANKFCSALLSENWSVASRLSLLPVLALSTAVRKLRMTA